MIYSKEFKEQVLAAYPEGHTHHDYIVSALESNNSFLGRILDDTNKRLYAMWCDEYAQCVK
jgi:hypothetical protein